MSALFPLQITVSLKRLKRCSIARINFDICAHVDEPGVMHHSCRCEGGYHACAGPADLANLPLQQMRQEAQALMADIGTSAAMQLQHVPVMIQGANGQQVVHYISMAGLQGVSQQQPTPAWR